MSLQAISFDLQITPGSIPPVLHMSQYDSGRQFTAYLKDETNTAFAPGTGATAKIKGFNAAGVAWEQAATVDGSTVVFAPSGAATDQFGVMPVTIEITVGGEKLTPLLMIFDIQRAGYTNEEAVRSPEFETAMEAAAEAAIEDVAVLRASQAAKSSAMTQPVGVDDNGKLWTTPGGGGLSDDAKQRLLACFAHVAWADEHGQNYYDALEDALYPPADLVSITAVYLQDRPIYDTDDLDAIKAGDDLTVTANYSDGSSVVLTDSAYTLSGTLTVGTSTITVSYGGKTTTISVLVTHQSVLYTLTAEDFTRGKGLRLNANSGSDYTQSDTKRICYVPFDLSISGGQQLRFTMTSTKETAQLAVVFYSDACMTKIENHTAIVAGTDLIDSTWQNSPYVIDLPATINDSPINCFRLQFRMDTNNSAITDDFVVSSVVVESVS